MRNGSIVEWNDARGFGFIEPLGGGERVFCHISQYRIRSRRPLLGEKVSYDLMRDDRGRPRALNVKPLGARTGRKTAPRPARTSAWPAALIVAVCMLAVAGLALVQRVPWWTPVLYLIASAITVFAYAFDKSAAMNGRWRTQESTLHLLALMGGWPGAWISQKLFRHKSRKASFQATFWLTVILNIAALGWIASGRSVQQLISILAR